MIKETGLIVKDRQFWKESHDQILGSIVIDNLSKLC